jgi:hypothetical protein
MEATGDLPLNQKIIVTNGKFDLVFCNALENKYKPACYFQMSSLIEKFTKNSNDHANNIKYCKQITDPVLRLACVEVVASVAVSQFHYNKVPQMCRDNTTNRVERILCTGIFASKIARGIDSSRNSELFTNTVDDICGTLSYFEASKCKELVKKNSLYLYLVNENSLAI